MRQQTTKPPCAVAQEAPGYSHGLQDAGAEANALRDRRVARVKGQEVGNRAADDARDEGERAEFAAFGRVYFVAPELLICGEQEPGDEE
jgi:hypothetical protein